jgi:hypothetical protein
MATGRSDAKALTEEAIEQFTDVMVGKLAIMAVQNRNNPDHPEWLTRDARPTNRDEIRQVIIDTELLVTGAVTLDEWLDGARDR